MELIDAEDGFDFNHLLEVEQQVKELTLRVKELESQLEHLRQERNQLEQRAQTLETERLEERRIIQEVNAFLCTLTVDLILQNYQLFAS